MPRFVLAIGLALLAAAPAMAQQTVPEDQMGKDEAVTRDQFWGIFVPKADRWRVFTRSPGDSVIIESRIYPTMYPGMCRQDHAVLLFAPTEAGVTEPGKTTPMRAYGINNTPYYRFFRAPGPEGAKFDDPWQGDAWNGPCSKLVYDGQFFTAPDEEAAFEGYRALLAARVAVTSGRVRIGRCRPPTDSGWRCKDLFADTDPPFLESIERCDARAHTACFIIESGGSIHTRIVVTHDDSDDDHNLVMPKSKGWGGGKVLSVDVDFDEIGPLGALD